MAILVWFGLVWYGICATLLVFGLVWSGFVWYGMCLTYRCATMHNLVLIASKLTELWQIVNQ